MFEITSKDLGFPEAFCEKYGRDLNEVKEAFIFGGRPYVAEVLLKNWASHYFSTDLMVAKTCNNAGFDIQNLDGSKRIEVKTCWNTEIGSNKYASFKSIKQKVDSKGNFLFTDIMFYAPCIDPNAVILFTAEEFNKEIKMPAAGKLNIKTDLTTGHMDSNIQRSSEAFWARRKEFYCEEYDKDARRKAYEFLIEITGSCD